MTQDTEIYELADIGERLMALIVDTIIVGAIGGIVGAGSTNFFWGSGIISFALGAAYQWYFLTQQDGQTIGKMLMNIRVVKTDGTPIADMEAIFRYVGYLINSPLLMLGWLLAFVDDSRQGLHDKIANTYVVKVPRR